MRSDEPKCPFPFKLRQLTSANPGYLRQMDRDLSQLSEATHHESQLPEAGRRHSGERDARAPRQPARPVDVGETV